MRQFFVSRLALSLVLIAAAFFSTFTTPVSHYYFVSEAEAANPAAKPVKEIAKELWEKIVGIGVKCLKGKCKQECAQCTKCLGGLSDEAKKILGKDRTSDAFAHELGQHLGIPPNNPMFKNGYLIVKGQAHNYNATMNEIATLLEKYPCMEETIKGKGVTLLHGSGSQSLVDLSTGLVPSGQLIQNGQVPFAGELAVGALKGSVNNNAISTTVISHMNSNWGNALDYAKGCGNKSWNPDIGKKTLAALEEAIAKAPSEGIKPGSLTDQMLKNGVEVEKARMARWEKLSEEQKKLVCDSYPVLYGLNTTSVPQANLSFPRSDCYGEVAVKDGVNWESVKVVYVPANKVEEVTKRLAAVAATKHVEVFPLDTVFTCPKTLRKARW